MAKRAHESDIDSRPPKRPRADVTPAVEEIQFARQLRELLTFRQDAVQQLRSGIASFKSFLESVLYNRSIDDRPRQLSILHEYLDSQKPSDPKDYEHPFLAQLWQAWSFANQAHNDNLTSAITALLALLLKTLSGLLEFREHGILLCRTLLHQGNLRLIKNGLEAPSHKDHLISPTLRLLTEAVSFDGGTLAKEIYKRREYTFEIGCLRRNLGLRKASGQEETKRTPSVRTSTIRYVLAHLKYQQEGPKIDMLKQRPLTSMLFVSLKDDIPDIVNELLKVIEQSVLRDDSLPRLSKGALLTQQNLERVTEVVRSGSEQESVSENALAWLRRTCTVPSYGVLRSSGWYPPATDKYRENDPAFGDGETIDLGLDSLSWYDHAKDDLTLRNAIMSGYLQHLRPHTSQEERQLVLAAFSAAPELVADYFKKRALLRLEPKLTNTWIGYASFLFEVIQLSPPDFFGGDHFAVIPPQSIIAIESLLPSPLTQKVLTKCLNHQSSPLIRFFGTRLLVVAFQKLSQILGMYREAAAQAERRDLWHEAGERLLALFSERCPKMKDVIFAFRRTPDNPEHLLQREAISRLMRLYYEVTPLVALDEAFDVSTALAAALDRGERPHGSDTDLEQTEMRSLELEHLLIIAQRSPSMRWFNQQGSLKHSPFVTLLKLQLQVSSPTYRGLLASILQEHALLQSDASNVSGLSPVDGFLAVSNSMSTTKEARSHDSLFTFLDECFGRAVKKPVKYLDDMDELVHATDSLHDKETPNISLLVPVVMEQAAFVQRIPLDERQAVVDWIRRYMKVSEKTEKDTDVVSLVDSKVAAILGDAYAHSAALGDIPALVSNAFFRPAEEEQQLLDAQLTETLAPSLPFAKPPVEDENHTGLNRWRNLDVEEAIETGAAADLCLCLSSKDESIRRQAHVNLQQLMEKVMASAVEDREQIWLLLGELAETAMINGLEHPLPYLAGAFGAKVLQVQYDPTHFLYPKINRYLNKGPSWIVSKMPTYWFEHVVLSVPDGDDAYWKEVSWIVEWLVDALRSEEDMDIFRSRGVFEKVLSLYSSPSANNTLKDRILELVWRASWVEGGSTTLITRSGILSWLGMVATVEKDRAEMLRLLKKRMLETCDQGRVTEWSHGAVKAKV